MGAHKDAAVAIDALDSKFVWEGMESPMVVKWMDTALQRRRREQHLASMRHGNMASGLSIGELMRPTAVMTRHGITILVASALSHRAAPGLCLRHQAGAVGAPGGVPTALHACRRGAGRPPRAEAAGPCRPPARDCPPPPRRVPVESHAAAMLPTSCLAAALLLLLPPPLRRRPAEPCTLRAPPSLPLPSTRSVPSALPLLGSASTRVQIVNPSLLMGGGSGSGSAADLLQQQQQDPSEPLPPGCAPDAIKLFVGERRRRGWGADSGWLPSAAERAVGATNGPGLQARDGLMRDGMGCGRRSCRLLRASVAHMPPPTAAGTQARLSPPCLILTP